MSTAPESEFANQPDSRAESPSAEPDGNPGAPWTAKVFTILPDAFPGTLGCSVIGQALSKGIWSLEVVDLREFGIGRHRDVDGPPAGGGAGMVLRPDVVAAAMDDAAAGGNELPAYCLSPRGQRFTQEIAASWASQPGVALLCGRFEGVDERVLEHYGITEVSVGDFVLSGGEIAAQALIEATVRLIPRVLGNQGSALDETFSEGGLLEHPHYTRPRVWRGRPTPEVLVSGHHGRVAEWRREQSERLTKERRPDLWRSFEENARPGEG